MNTSHWYIAALCCLVFLGCQQGRDNPLDPEGEKYTRPSFKSFDLGKGDTLTSSTLTFSWDGNLDSNLFRYKLSDDDIWSAWMKDKSVTVSYLDDDTYTVTVQTMYPLGKDTVTISHKFYVRANQNAMVKAFRLKSSTSIQGTTTIQIRLQSITKFFATSFRLSFDNSKVALQSIAKGDLLNSTSFSSAILPDPTVGSVITGANAQGYVDLTVGILPGSGTPTTISGTGVILLCQFKGLATGEGPLSISNVVVKDDINQSQAINPSPAAKIIVR